MRSFRRLSQLPVDEAIKILKDEATPKSDICYDIENQCGIKAGKNVLDDWGDSCEGQGCLLIKGHIGNHMATDGANGWVYYK